MEAVNVDFEVVEQQVMNAAPIELSDLQLALVGGGVGEVILG